MDYYTLIVLLVLGLQHERRHFDYGRTTATSVSLPVLLSTSAECIAAPSLHYKVFFLTHQFHHPPLPVQQQLHV